MNVSRKPVDKEGVEQTAFFRWMRLAYPKAEALTFHIPNGGQRNAITGAKLKQQGAKAGVPDIFIAVPRGRYSGCFIEFKAAPRSNGAGRTVKNYPTQNQKEWLVRLSEQGYHTVLCYGFEEIRAEVEQYMALTENKMGER